MIKTIKLTLIFLLIALAIAEKDGNWRWVPPQRYVRFRRCFYGCQCVVTNSCSYWVLPEATDCSTTLIPIPHTGVIPMTITQTTNLPNTGSCIKCSVTTTPVKCTTIMVCNPAKTNCPASYTTLGSLTFTQITSLSTVIPSSLATGSAISLSESHSWIVAFGIGALVIAFLFA